MRNVFLIIGLVLASFQMKAQSKTGIKIAYIDMEYILENVPDYKEAATQLDQKAQKWKQDVEAKKNEIAKLKENLKNEKALLTKELIEEREEEIKFQEAELMDYQQKRFGPKGDLAIQKAAIIKPVQDQVFNAVQDIAETRKYDFVFDKSSDLTILFSDKRHNISDQIVRVITRAEKREEMSKKQLKKQEVKEEEQDKEDENDSYAARKKALEDKNAARIKAIEDRRKAAEEKRKATLEARKKTTTTDAENKNGTTIDSTKTESKSKEEISSPENKISKTDSIKNANEAKRLQQIEANKKAQEERKRILEEKKKKVLEEREAAKKAKEAPKTTN